MRLHPDWVYGLPELGSSQRSQISMANRVANPGCFAAAFILLVHPLVESGVLSSDQIIHAFGTTGYSAGGKRMISDYETNGKSGAVHSLRRTHRHVPEMRQFSGLLNSPSFVAIVGGHKEGLILTIPLPGYPRRSLTSVLQDAYQSETLASFIGECPNTLSPVSFKGNQIEIFVGGSDNHCTLVARMSNLLKGAATTAVQNLNLMLSLDEFTGLK